MIKKETWYKFDIKKQREENGMELDENELKKIIKVAIIEAVAHNERKREEKDGVLTKILAVVAALWYIALFAIMGAGAIIGVEIAKILWRLMMQCPKERTVLAAFVLAVFVIIMLILLAVTMMLLAIELFKEKNRSFLFSSLSFLTGLTALLVSLIALLG